MSERSPEDLAQAQLDAYNGKDIKAFVACYHKDVEVFDFQNGELRMKGLEAFEERYTKLFQNTKIHARLEQRMSLGAVVMDKEFVTGMGDDPVEAIAIYEVAENLIRKVWFVKA